MCNNSKPLLIHSLTEARLYVRIRPCDACPEGSLQADIAGLGLNLADQILVVPAQCKTCGKQADIRFALNQIDHLDLAAWLEPAVEAINPTNEISQVLDVADWLTLHSLIEMEAKSAENPLQARKLHLEAAQCIDEAMKFFDEDNDLPPPDAFYSDRSMRQFRDHPEHFTREHLIDLRNRLPVEYKS